MRTISGSDQANSPLVYLHLIFEICTANPFPVMITGISLCSNSHREFPVMNT